VVGHMLTELAAGRWGMPNYVEFLFCKLDDSIQPPVQRVPGFLPRE
jgi:hypothetical protein